MKLNELLLEDKSANLYLAVGIQYFYEQLANDKMYATVIHRWWQNGARYNEMDQHYKDHVWIKGLSLSRSLAFCLRWNPLTFIFDQQKLSNKYKLLPMRWSKSRHEFEEFLWMNTSVLSGNGPEVTRYANDKNFSIHPLHNYIKGIVISKYYSNKIITKPDIDIIKSYCDKYKLTLEWK